MMDEYTLERKSTQSEEEKTKTKASVNTALQVMERLLSEERNQRVIASTRVKELEIQLEETREVKERTLNELQKLTKEKQLLEEELAIRICTHDLADLPQQTTEVIKLKARVETLSKELETKSNAFEQCREEKDAEIGGLEYKLSELQTQIVILNSKHDEELERVKHEVIQKESETGTVRREMQERIDLLHRDMEVSKQEYSDAIQALAANFQRSMGIVAASAED
jgi:hypothetical protein